MYTLVGTDPSLKGYQVWKLPLAAAPVVTVYVIIPSTFDISSFHENPRKIDVLQTCVPHATPHTKGIHVTGLHN